MFRPFRHRRPQVADSAYVDSSAQLIGDIAVGERASIWCSVTIRGDVNSIRIGDDSNVQDNSCLHVDRDAPLEIGARVVVGHSATVHGCTIEDECLIGMGATVLSKARVGEGSIVAAGAVVREGEQVPPGSLVAGVPAKVRREVTPEERARIREGAQNYVDLSREYLERSD